METCTIAQLKEGERGIISSFDVDKIPLKLIKLDCFVGSEVEVLQKAILGDPIYIRMNEAYLSIGRDMAALMQLTTNNKQHRQNLQQK